MGTRERPVTELKNAVVECKGVESSSPWVKGAPSLLKRAVSLLSEELEGHDEQHCEWKAIKLLEGDSEVGSQEDETITGFVNQLSSRLETTRGISSAMLVARARGHHDDRQIAQLIGIADMS